jgi:hypothetical protein
MHRKSKFANRSIDPLIATAGLHMNRAGRLVSTTAPGAEWIWTKSIQELAGLTSGFDRLPANDWTAVLIQTTRLAAR